MHSSIPLVVAVCFFLIEQHIPASNLHQSPFVRLGEGEEAASKQARPVQQYNLLIDCQLQQYASWIARLLYHNNISYPIRE